MKHPQEKRPRPSATCIGTGIRYSRGPQPKPEPAAKCNKAKPNKAQWNEGSQWNEAQWNKTGGIQTKPF
jgi:hypothetical protein